MTYPRLLPPNATPFELALEQSTARQLDKILIQRIVEQWSPQNCPAHLLGYLAWGVSVDEWDPDWSEQTQREVIASSVDVHRHKGTIGSVKKALEAEGYTVQIEERPYFQFIVTIGGAAGALTEALYNRLQSRVLGYQAARCHYQIRFAVQQQTSSVQALYRRPPGQIVRLCLRTAE